jgi:hypothetical protein
MPERPNCGGLLAVTGLLARVNQSDFKAMQASA